MKLSFNQFILERKVTMKMKNSPYIKFVPKMQSTLFHMSSREDKLRLNYTAL